MSLTTKLTPEQTAAYLRTLPAIRERCSRVHTLATEGKLEYFDYHPEREDAVASFCIDIMKVSSYLTVYKLRAYRSRTFPQRDFGDNFASVSV